MYDDCILRIFDAGDAKKPRRVRSFVGHQGAITDLAIGSDGRMLCSSSVDGTVRVWDIPSSRCLNTMQFGSIVTSLSLSMNGEFLATTHAEKVGIYIWSSVPQAVQLGTGNADRESGNTEVMYQALPQAMPSAIPESWQGNGSGDEKQRGDGVDAVAERNTKDDGPDCAKDDQLWPLRCDTNKCQKIELGSASRARSHSRAPSAGGTCGKTREGTVFPASANNESER